MASKKVVRKRAANVLEEGEYSGGQAPQLQRAAATRPLRDVQAVLAAIQDQESGEEEDEEVVGSADNSESGGDDDDALNDAMASGEESDDDNLVVVGQEWSNNLTPVQRNEFVPNSVGPVHGLLPQA